MLHFRGVQNHLSNILNNIRDFFFYLQKIVDDLIPFCR
jgi:hypothetical protein